MCCMIYTQERNILQYKGIITIDFEKGISFENMQTMPFIIHNWNTVRF